MNSSRVSDVNAILEAALTYARLGWRVFPLHSPTGDGCSCAKPTCEHIGKHPRTKHGLKDATTDEGKIRVWWLRWPDANVAVATGADSGLVVQDTDPRNGGDKTEASFPEQGRDIPETLKVRTGGGGWHRLYAHPGGGVKSTSGILPGIDVKADGGYVVAPPSRHASGAAYQWESGCAPGHTSLAPAPAWLLELLSPSSGNGHRRVSASQRAAGGVGAATAYARATMSNLCTELASAPNGTRNETLNRAAFVSGQLIGGGQITESDARAQLEAAEAACGLTAEESGPTAKTREAAINRGRREPRIPSSQPHAQREVHPAEDAASGELVPFTGRTEPKKQQRAKYLRADAGNAELFASMHGNDLRFDHRRWIWRVWAGHSWREDDDGMVWRFAKHTARELFKIAGGLEAPDEREAEGKWALKSMNRERLSSMLRLAQNESSLTDAGNDWDADPWLLGVRNGVIDLRKSQLRPGRREDRITKSIDLIYDANAGAPRFHRLLNEIFGHDRELVAFINRAAGYSATGATNEQCLFLCHGGGSNGKSTLLRTFLKTLGPYGRNAPFSTLEMDARTSIPEDVARLDGARLVTASETSVSARLNEARVKALTGDDPISACYKYGHWFTFRPVLKLWLAVNHKPRVSDTSFAFWRRVRLIPFLQRFDPRAEPDLEATLAGEAPGILAWLVLGARFWQERGLDPPATVTSATETYRAESDVLADFLDECTQPEQGESLSRAGVVYVVYGEWAERQGLRKQERLGSRRFGEEMTGRYPKEHDKAGWHYLGLGLSNEGRKLQELADRRAEKRAVLEPR